MRRMQTAIAIGGINAPTNWIDYLEPQVPCHPETLIYPDINDMTISLYAPSRGWRPLMIVYDLRKPEVDTPDGEEFPHRHSYLKIIAEKTADAEDIIPWRGSQELEQTV